MAQAFSKSTILGTDVSEEGIEKAKANVSADVKNIQFQVADLSNMPQEWSDKFDFVITHFVIHDVPKASQALKEICRILKPGAIFLPA